MSLDHTAAGMSWSNAGILVMEDGLIYGRAHVARRGTRNLGAAAPASRFECVVLFSLIGIAVSAALLVGASPQTISLVTAGLTP